MDWTTSSAAIWRPKRGLLRAVRRLDPVRLEDLLGIDEQKRALIANTEAFLKGGVANNALLWGSRGTGKSSLIKALLNQYSEHGLRLIEIDKDDLVDLLDIVEEVETLPYRFIVYCDDLSFEEGENSYKHLKSVVEGSIELPPDNVLIYATSNRRHLVPEYNADNAHVKLVDGELHYTDAIEEKLSLADRFGLWLSFYPFDLQQYFRMVDALMPEYGDREELHRLARQFAMVRGNRSGRTARQFVSSLGDAVT
jgi:uncharacterized protein